MVHHLVFWKLKPEAEGRVAAENAREMVQQLKALTPLIPEIKALEVGVDFNRSAAAWDVALATVFESREALDIYQHHPEHKRVAAFVGRVTEARAVVDFEA